ncbi:hypothetical protein BD324DRAFT_632299 [Kockovaella imperatae]|uniref:Uncharacterized protein n=1 Tax=Kockovaella imperatae TaxID=4999 RepID=A0A1Y1UB98_9TREE|nr:hypothetical protein BD324DRAFT_632299 [Kockovaella imperatae]ORX35311.1 hypothetical protein BD324DRAFT_632299 [Kockovaella imperatae]
MSSIPKDISITKPGESSTTGALGVRRRSSRAHSSKQAENGHEARNSNTTTSLATGIGVGKSGRKRVGEPARRGDEEDLISPSERETTNVKRPRHQSPRKPLSEPPDPPDGPDGIAGKGKIKDTGPMIDPDLLLKRVHSYPSGLTPFRYPCHHLELPSPPVSDPNDPNFKRYDPAAKTYQLEPTEISSYPGNSVPAPLHPRQTLQPGDESTRQLLPQSGGADIVHEAEPYESLSALLSASDFQNHFAELEAQGIFAQPEGPDE